ncbi:MAG: AI-2E family transporter [Parafilimonas sp.]
MEKNITLPFYVKLSQIIIGVAVFFYVMYIGQDIILPLIFALIIAILLNPFVNFLQRKKMNRIVAILFAVLLALMAILSLLFLIGSQATTFSDSLPQFKQKFADMLADGIQWFSTTFNVSTKQVNEWLAKTKSEGLSKTTSVIGQTLTTISGMLVLVFLLPVYVFLFLFYKSLLLQFMAKLFPPNKHAAVAEVLTETKSLIQNYLIGLLLEAGIVAALNTLSLFIIGIEYALLLGVIGALLNIIPYIGGVIAIALPMLLALATKEPIYALYVLAAYAIVQFIDNNFIVPKIVASKVRINALVSIIVVLIGGALWGVPGMFLSLPLTAIIKVIFDRIEPLKPFGFLAGDNQPKIGKIIFHFRNPIKKKKAPVK